MALNCENGCVQIHRWWHWEPGGHKPPQDCTCTTCLEAYERACSEWAGEAEARTKLVWEQLCPADYREVDLARLPDPVAFERVQVWQYGPRGLLAHGPPRKGKTRAMWQLIRRLVHEGREVAAFNCVSFGHRVMALGHDPQQFVAWITRLHKVMPVVFIDDPWGKGKLTERAIAELFGLIENRMANQLPLLMTMNMTGAQIEAYIGGDRAKPLVARLMECCESVAFTGKKGGA